MANVNFKRVYANDGRLYGRNGIQLFDLDILTGPVGADGADGATGATGPQGPPGDPGGPPGPEGLSAYEVAVLDGFNGTEAEWLASLVGPQGATGAQGIQGIQGIQGVTGDTGPQGNQGNTGNTGAPGLNQVTTSTATNITGLLKGDGAVVSAASAPADYVATGDSRLSDARTPSAHKTSHQDGGSDEINVGALSGVLADPQPPIIGSGATQAVAGDDARLTDARTPTAHEASHLSAGSDPLAGLSPSQITGTAVVTADSRLSDARTPTTHASTHSLYSAVDAVVPQIIYVSDEALSIPSGVIDLASGNLMWTDARIQYNIGFNVLQPVASPVFWPGSITQFENDPFILDSPYLADLGGNPATVLWTDAARCPTTVSTLLVIGV